MSVPAGTVAPMHHPWRAVRGMPGWEVVFTDDLPAGVVAATTWDDRTLWVRRGLTQAERRCAIEHERQHVMRGVVCGDADEAFVEQATARALISLDALADALRWSRHPREVADALWVTQAVLRCRVRHLHPVERAALAHAVEHHVA